MRLSEYEAVVKPKIEGTWNLHKISEGSDLDFFIMLSSTSGLIGNASQAAYAASSTFLDSFAVYRRARGLAATTIDLGVITDIGYVSENKDLARALERQGFEGTSPEELMALMHVAIESGPASSSSHTGNEIEELTRHHIVTGLGTWREGAIGAFDRAIFSHFRRAGQRDAAEDSDPTDDGGAATMKVRAPLKAARRLEDALKLVREGLKAKISSLSMIPVNDISTENPLSYYGMDSLVAVEMRNWIARELDATVPVLELMANQPMHVLSGKVVAKSRLVTMSALEV